MASVAHIFVAQKHGSEMLEVESARAVGGSGLEGDRHRRGVTLIELENIEGFCAQTGLALTPGMPRRNIVTRGIRLNDLVGRQFALGGALLEGYELAEPCSLFARRTHREILSFFPGKGGLRARVLSGATIRVGDSIGDEGRPRRTSPAGVWFRPSRS